MNGLQDFAIGDRIVRPALGEIRNGDAAVHVEPRSMEVLVALSKRPGEVFSKTELIQAVWGGAFVSDEVLTHAIWDLRRAFGDQATAPKFIQTIPKRGYRLIAPVEALEPEGAPVTGEPPSTDWRLRRKWLLILFFALTVGAVLAMRANRQTNRPSLASQKNDQSASGPVSLVVVPTKGPEEAARTFHERLKSELAGLPGVRVVDGSDCPEAADRDTYCVETSLARRFEGLNLTMRLDHARSKALVYGLPDPRPVQPEEVPALASESSDLIATFFEVREISFFSDPDFMPWIDFRRHDLRAVRSFLSGLSYVYFNEVGGRHAMEDAIERDPDFAAPRVIRTPTILDEGDQSAIAQHRGALQDLLPTATPFEAAMIRWATAILDGDLAAAIRQLRAVLETEPENRPALLMLAVALMAQDDLHRAWQTMQPLVEERWEFPGLYSVAGQCALLRGDVDEARSVLEAALGGRFVDPETLSLLVLMAVYDQDNEAEYEYQRRLTQRRKQMLPEVFEFDMSRFAVPLAELATAEGRPGVADKLREFVD